MIRTMNSSPRVYHRKPPDMQGQVLYPLNVLQNISVQHYDKQRAKYVGRETLMTQPIPPLNCIWNDVIHLSPVHPAKLAACARDVGLPWQVVDWFEIDPSAMRFTADNTAIFHYRNLDYGSRMENSEFDPFDPDWLPAHCEVPQATRDYYKSMVPRGRYLLFVGVPHVLHRGSLCVDTLPVIRV